MMMMMSSIRCSIPIRLLILTVYVHADEYGGAVKEKQGYQRTLLSCVCIGGRDAQKITVIARRPFVVSKLRPKKSYEQIARTRKIGSKVS